MIAQVQWGENTVSNILQSPNSRETIGTITRAGRKTFTVASYHIDSKAAKKKDVVSTFFYRLLGECVTHTAVEALCGDNNSGAFRGTNKQEFYDFDSSILKQCVDQVVMSVNDGIPYFNRLAVQYFDANTNEDHQKGRFQTGAFHRNADLDCCTVIILHWKKSLLCKTRLELWSRIAEQDPHNARNPEAVPHILDYHDVHSLCARHALVMLASFRIG